MARSNDETLRMTKGRVRIDTAATTDRAALEHAHAEVEGLRKRVARLEFALAGC